LQKISTFCKKIISIFALWKTKFRPHFPLCPFKGDLQSGDPFLQTEQQLYSDNFNVF
jgi:hypothetical protein